MARPRTRPAPGANCFWSSLLPITQGKAIDSRRRYTAIFFIYHYYNIEIKKSAIPACILVWSARGGHDSRCLPLSPEESPVVGPARARLGLARLHVALAIPLAPGRPRQQFSRDTIGIITGSVPVEQLE